MGIRSKFVALTAAVGAVGLTALRARPGSGLEQAAEGLIGSIMSSVAGALFRTLVAR